MWPENESRFSVGGETLRTLRTLGNERTIIEKKIPPPRKKHRKGENDQEGRLRASVKS